MLPVRPVNRESSVRLPQHPDEHRSKRRSSSQSISGSANSGSLQVAPELADPVGALEVGAHQDGEEFGAGSRTQGPKALTEPALDVLQVHKTNASTEERLEFLG